jgi:hypothetical protein
MIDENREKHKALRALHLAREKYLIAVYTAECLHQSSVASAELQMNNFAADCDIDHSQAREIKEQLFEAMLRGTRKCEFLGIKLCAGRTLS